MNKRSFFAIAILLAALVSVSTGASTDAVAAKPDRHAGYYYPTPATTETYKARAQIMNDAKAMGANCR